MYIIPDGKLRAPVTMPISDRQYMFREHYTAIISDGKSVWMIGIDPGFKFDGASIPRFAWTITGVYPMAAMIQAPAGIHDALYASRYLPRKTNDKIFRRDLGRNGYSWFIRATFYRCVRSFGGFAYMSHTEESIQNARKFVKIVQV